MRSSPSRQPALRSARCLLCLFALLIPFVVRSVHAQETPNIIVIMADDLGWGDLSCYGHQRLKTPNIDRMAAEGTLFTQFYAGGPTGSPTRAALMTGRFPSQLGIHADFSNAGDNADRGMPNWLDPQITTLTNLMSSANIWTAHFGKWHLGHVPSAPQPASYGIRTSRTTHSTGESWGPTDNFQSQSSALIMDETLRFIRDHRNDPFYINVWMAAPHAPLAPTEEQIRPFLRYSWNQGNVYRSAATIYYASVAELDNQVGRLLDELERLELTDETLVIFMSDNGPEDIHIRNAGHSAIGSAGPFRGRKRSLYEGGIRVPFIARWPGRIPVSRIDDTSVIAAVDLLPTFCRLSGIAVNAEAVDGEDISDILVGQSRARRRPLMWQWRFRVFGEPIYHSPMLTIRDGNWKLLLNPDRSRVELYDIPNDPMELDNRAHDEPELVERLADQLLSWQRSLPAGPVDPQAGRNDYPWPQGAGR